MRKSVVQSVLIPRRFFTIGAAQKWLRENGYTFIKLDLTQNYYRFRQIPPDSGCRYRTKELPNGVLLVLCWK